MSGRPVMLAPRVELLVEEDDGGLVVRAPCVGLWCDPPPPGRPLGPGSDVGTLVRLNRRFRLLMPEGSAGLVGEGVPALRVVPVEYGQTLFRLAAAKPAQAAAPTRALREGGAADTDLPDGTHAVLAPTDGVFYRRPSPDAAPFIEVGSRIAQGDAVGLVEVMKTFNQIVYGGAGLPERAEVIEIRCEDAQEVRAGQLLVLVTDRPGS
jgi:biotin carboxyl carrier protein